MEKNSKEIILDIENAKESVEFNHQVNESDFVTILDSLCFIVNRLDNIEKFLNGRKEVEE